MSNKDRWIIPLSDVPSQMAIHEYILKFTDLKMQIEKFSNYNSDGFRKVKILFDNQKIKNSVLSGIAEFGLHEFRYADSAAHEQSPYVSSSLTWNPNAKDKVSADPHLATLGSNALKWNSASLYNLDQHELIPYRNTYNDTYSFVERTPFSNHLFLKEFFDSFKRTLIRSRVSTIKAGRVEATKFDFCWHNDEQVFLNLRINIPIQTSSNYSLQIIKNADANELVFDEFSMESGFAYVYDSGKNHRPFCKKLDTLDRIHLICGISPWFDFDCVNQSWVSNEYYGKIHPFEMFESGLISAYLSK